MKFFWSTIPSHRTLAMVIAGTFLFVALVGLPLWMHSSDSNAMTMPGCPFLSAQTTVCQMSVMEHIAQWQRLFTAVAPEFEAFASTLLLLMTLVLFLVLPRGSPTVFSVRTLSPPIPKSKPDVRLFHTIVVAFSDGILHPKIYA